ncbi:uncharacterized protein LOC120841069 [Ixodes scapularis]|uniref:uncharacterized protein LOC120841069 n=1 Tax=Ixodes scapularis TaxID=6945 RepID=UPI001AA004F3|nr:uncharacterized protein LOC120841069 [Ixodes scapularis]
MDSNLPFDQAVQIVLNIERTKAEAKELTIATEQQSTCHVAHNVQKVDYHRQLPRGPSSSRKPSGWNFPPQRNTRHSSPFHQASNGTLVATIVPSGRNASHTFCEDSQTSLQYHFRRAHNTVSNIVADVCPAIYSVLRDDFLKVPSSPAEWKAVAQGYQDLWQFPHCVGALDGKHVALVPPHETGAQFRNYKGFFSIVLMALVDADLNFIFVDVGRNGRMNDSGIWGACKLKETLERQPSILPDAELLPRSRDSAPYVIVGDEGFGLKPYLMRPYPAAELTTDKRLFNYRLSRARRTSENAFGVLVNRWQIYRSPLRHDPKRATDIVLATVALHNFLRSKRITRQLYTPQDSLDVEDILTGNVRNGSWRQGVTPAGAMRQFRRGGSNSSDTAKAVRNLFMNYFVNEGQVSWQWRMIP